MDSRLRILALVVALTVIFHETLAKAPFGVSFGLFIVAYLIVFHLATQWSKHQRNLWALVFLIPVLADLLSASWYASPALQVLTWVTVVPALALFSYWVTQTSYSWRDVFSLTPSAFFKETLWPFRRFREHLSFPTRISGRETWQILLGLVVGFPLLWIIASLFSAADSTFAQLFDTLFRWDILPTDAGVWLLDLLVGLFFLGFIGTAARRLLLPRVASEEAVTPTAPYKDSLALHTFLVALNVLFFVFVVIQALYVIQGASHWLLTGLTYADYAKQSFYQLFWVGVLVLGIAFFCYRVTGTKLRTTRVLLLTLIAQTAVVLVSAWLRLSLYVSAYNLTLARWWGGIGLLVVALVLAWCAVCFVRRAPVTRFIQGVVIGTLLFAIPLVLVNHEGRVAEYNIGRFLNSETSKLDVSYLLDLSSDVTPALVTLANRRWDINPNLQLRAHGRCLEGETELTCLHRALDLKRQALQSSADTDWRLLTRNDWYALQLLSAKK